MNTTGKYTVGCSVNWATNATGQRGLFLRRDGSTTIATNTIGPSSGGAAAQNINIVVLGTSASTYWECGVFQNSGGDLDVDQQAEFSPEFYAQLIAE